MLFGDWTISLLDDAEMPACDWDGLQSESLGDPFTQQFAEPVTTDNRNPSPVIVSLLTTIATPLTGPNVAFRTSTVMTDSHRKHAYLFSIPASRATLLLQGLSDAFSLRNGVGSFEFFGTAMELETLVKSGSYQLEAFPSNCWSLNNSRTPFALQRNSLLRPALNLDATRLPAVASAIDSSKAQIPACSLTKKYISWN